MDGRMRVGKERVGWEGKRGERRGGEMVHPFLGESYALSITLNCKGLFTARKVN